jgi:signal transduction histidine kinase
MGSRVDARLVLAFAAVLGCLGVPTSAWAQAASLKTVLTITQGAETFPSNPILDAAIRETLASRRDLPIDYFTEYWESDAFPDENASLAFREYVRTKYLGRRIDLVVAITDSVLRFALTHRDELFPDAPIVFTGVGVPNERIVRSGAGLTGITVGTAYSETLKLALQLQPDTQEVLVVAQGRDDTTVEGVQAELARVSRTLKLTYLTQPTIPGLLAAVAAAPPRSVILYIWRSQREPGHVVYADEVARLLSQAASVPTYGTSDFYIGSGIVGGVVRRTRETGTRMGHIALRILTGTPAAEIPIETARTAAIVDARELRRWNVSDTRVPAGTQILFSEPGVWDQYKFYIVGAAVLLVAQSGLIAALLFQARRRRRAEARIRDLGSRLLGAQEAERSRIARELHDDVSQQATILAMDLQQLADSNEDTHNTELAREAMERSLGIARSLHDLAHRLHPARLRILGLVPALQSLCAEGPHNVTITFSHNNVPDGLAEDLTLCLYRIAQEALQNAIKHGAAQSVWVDLTGKDAALALVIADDGIGFDVDARSPTGLGLTSMRERLEPLGGTLGIDSRPGAGTRLHVSVPVTFV